MQENTYISEKRKKKDIYAFITFAERRQEH
jgi:hypothetical protein